MSSPSSSSTIDRIQRLEQLLEHGSPRGTTSALTPTSPAIHDNASTTTINPIFKPAQNFPSAFFLDPAFFSPINDNVLSSTAPSSPSIHKAALVHLGPDGANVVGEYLATVQTWFPIVSKKRLLRPETENPSSTSDGCGPLLLLAMKLCVVGRRDSPIYHVVRSLCAAAETAGVVSLRLVQALILLALFEVAHAIYPGAYLTTGRVARLAALMGMQAGGQEVPRPFRNFDTWTLREEHVRARWAIVILDR